MANAAAELERLLAEPADAARERGRGLWGTLWRPGMPLVLHGAGNVGRLTLHHLRGQGVEPVAFADADPARQESLCEGLPVLAPAEAAARFGGKGLFLVTIINREHSYLAVARAYQALGVARTAPAAAYFWAHPEDLLPYFALSVPEVVLEQREAVLAAWEALDDPVSRNALTAYVRWRMHLDYAALPGPCAGEVYFPADLPAPRGRQCYVDCGAYDGDSLRQFLARPGIELEHAHLLEPDPRNFGRLAAHIGDLAEAREGRITLHPLAVGAGPGWLRFRAEGESSAFCADGELEVPVNSLDRVLAGVAPTFIKLDIEGAEPEALEGAAGLLRAHGPAVAACVYHCPDHPWRIPLALKRLLPDHRIALRAHAADGCEWVAYAFPG
jgi:FkbM family methyltransferase